MINSEKDKNKALMLLLQKLVKEADKESIELIKYLVRDESQALKFSFNIMVENAGIEKFEIMVP